jgi:hypothetical protein
MFGIFLICLAVLVPCVVIERSVKVFRLRRYKSSNPMGRSGTAGRSDRPGRARVETCFLLNMSVGAYKMRMPTIAGRAYERLKGQSQRCSRAVLQQVTHMTVTGPAPAALSCARYRISRDCSRPQPAANSKIRSGR